MNAIAMPVTIIEIAARFSKEMRRTAGLRKPGRDGRPLETWLAA
jgi:hypothetical protein